MDACNRNLGNNPVGDLAAVGNPEKDEEPILRGAVTPQRSSDILKAA